MPAPDEIFIDGVKYRAEATVYSDVIDAYITIYEEIGEDICIEIPQEGVRIYFDGRNPCRESIRE